MSELSPAVVETVTAAIAEIDPDHLNDREVIAFLAGISETAAVMRQAKPDLSAHADLVMDLANRVFAANEAAERRGYEQAITHLRREMYGEWFDRQDEPPARTLGPRQLAAAADYLSARLTEETTG